ncbi:replication-relaxation family protein [Streptomyces sp. NPDC093707]|uniref:replication-relaxation family protein n=1 Tax=Streptomyces sp. NPDC093707 TaxID=3154984 RepID=UPI00344DD949
MPALPRPASVSRYVARAVTTRPRPHHRINVALLSRNLTDRDLWLVHMLHEHRVLTTHQVTRLAYPSLRTAQRRLRTLHQHAVLDSFRPLTVSGSAPEHYALGPAGAILLAAHTGLDTTTLGWDASAIGRIAYSPCLGHDLGVNELLTHLAARTHTAPTTALRLWLSERSAARRWGDIIRPDAYAHWHHGDRLLPFFLEYETGSQALARVEAKLPGYAAFTATTGTRPALLIHTRTQCRDQALRHRLAGTVHELGLLVATASADLTTTTPWGPWWAPLHPDAHRVTLAELATHWPRLSPATGLEPTDTDTALTRPIPPLPPLVRTQAGT